MGLKALKEFATTLSALLISRNLPICKVKINFDIVRATLSNKMINLSTFKKAEVPPPHRGKKGFFMCFRKEVTTL